MQNEAIAAWLQNNGLLLCAFHWQDLPSSLRSSIEDAIDRTAGSVHKDSNLLLLLNAGPRFWRSLQVSSIKDNPDPVDAYSIELAQDFSNTFLPMARSHQLYPTPGGQAHIPLMRLGGLAGLNVPSPLGLGLHPEYGPWSAYRVAWLTDSNALPVDACPASAVHVDSSFNTAACYEHRQPEHSACHTHCFSRKACPIGIDHQYDDDQLAHHMSYTWR